MPCKVLLVGRSIHSEIQILDQLGLRIEEPVVGVVDTQQLAEMHWSQPGSLSSLLTLSCIPYTMSTLHCAGNDANYTLQLLFSLLCEMHRKTSALGMTSALSRMRELSTQAVPPRIRDTHIVEDNECQIDLCDVSFLSSDYDESERQRMDPEELTRYQAD